MAKDITEELTKNQGMLEYQHALLEKLKDTGLITDAIANVIFSVSNNMLERIK